MAGGDTTDWFGIKKNYGHLVAKFKHTNIIPLQKFVLK